MPWREVDPMSERLRFIADARRRIASLAAPCRHRGVCRKTGYQWPHRADREGTAHLHERSRRPKTCPHAIPAPTEPRSRPSGPAAHADDGFSRSLLTCRALTGTTGAESRQVFERLFREYGLPTILTHRQRRPVRHRRHPPPLAAQRRVDPAGDLPRAD